MERYRRQSAYQLSSESLPSGPDELNSIKNLSPIPNKSIRISQSENNIYARRNSAAYENARAFDKLTSTPMTWKHREANGAISGDSRLTHRQVNKSDLSTSLTDSQREEGQDSSPWGTSISPKIRCRAAGIKTVQTVAGPLLASTRYNIDTK
uniref:Uncharacterized protein n=1 Tax=Bracon brevicornis TaxID=1563983 RepID=A0A6V7M3U4_9HYME